MNRIGIRLRFLSWIILYTHLLDDPLIGTFEGS